MVRKTRYDKLVEDMQIQFIKDPSRCIYVKNGKNVLISHMSYGVYIRDDKCLLDYSKFKVGHENGCTDPKKMLERYELAEETSKLNMYTTRKIAVQLKSENSSCWVSLDLRKKFGENVKLFIGTEKEPVLVTDKKDIALGIIMPVLVRD